MPLTREQQARSERNRQNALLLREQKAASSRGEKFSQPPSASSFGADADSGGGFMLDNAEDSAAAKRKEKLPIVQEPAPLADPDDLRCDDCDASFHSSFLYDRFGEKVCTACYEANREEAYSLVTRTDAKSRYLLKDCDLDKRPPPLRYVTRRNPHNSRWGDMRLYLEAQVAERALLVWGSEEALEAEREKRDAAKDRGRKRRYDREMKDLRYRVRASLRPDTQYEHEHEFGEETPTGNEDEFSTECSICGYKRVFCKM